MRAHGARARCTPVAGVSQRRPRVGRRIITVDCRSIDRSGTLRPRQRWKRRLLLELLGFMDSRLRDRRVRLGSFEGFGPVVTRFLLVQSVQSSCQAGKPNSHAAFNLIIAESPLEHERAHSQTLPCLLQRSTHLAEVNVAKELVQTSLHLPHGIMIFAFCLKYLPKHLLQCMKVGLANSELLLQLTEQVGWEVLAGPGAVLKTSLEGQKNLACGKEAVGKII